MKTRTDKHYLTTAWLWIAGVTLFRIVYARAFLLSPDETNYWQWSRYLDWGYHDQTPMIAWVIKLSTLLLGHTALGVRMPSILAMAVASIYLVLISKRWFGAGVALAAAVLSQGIFEFNVGGLLATCDGIQAAAWAGAAYHVARGYEENTWKDWILGGLWFGFGFLSKYTMVLFLPCTLMYGLLSGQHRSRLAGIRPYVGVLLGLCMFVPVLYWNSAHGWNSVRHVAYIGGANEGFSLHYKYLGDFLGSQAALLTPLVFILILWAWHRVFWKKYDTKEWIYSYLFFTSFPVVALFLLLSLHSRIYGNWPAAGYLTGSVLAAVFFSRRKIWKWSIGIAYGFSAIVLLQVVFPVLPIPVSIDRTAYELKGWDEIGIVAGKARGEMPDPEKTFLFGLKYQIASELAFYVPGQPKTVAINRWNRPNVYDYWWKDEDLIGKDAVGVTLDKADGETKLREVFEKVDPPEAITISRKHPFTGKEEIVKTVYLFRAYGFKGGIHWQPADRNDVRASDTY